MKTYTKDDVAKLIDHAVLKPEATVNDLKSNAEMCMRRNVGCLCVRPCDVAVAVDALKGSQTIVASVIGFPHGNSRTETKALETKLAVEDGAVEVDMVMNIGRFLSCETDYVKADIEAVVAEAKPKSVAVKVILETCLLTPEQIAEACKIAEAAGADFVKTSTGFASGGATPDAIDIMVKTVGKTMKVKASGGIRNWDDAVAYLNQGCDRLGIGSTETVLDGGTSSEEY
jgi:deoxyribose-phosphate aldolase